VEGGDKPKRSVPQDTEGQLQKLLDGAVNKGVLRRRKRVAALADELHEDIDPLEDAAFEEVIYLKFYPYSLSRKNK